MERITSKDIKALRECLDKLEEMHKGKPEPVVTKEEWDDFFNKLDATGMFPPEYEGRIAVKDEVLPYDDRIEGHPVLTPDGTKRTIYYDVALEKENARYYELQREYGDSIVKLLGRRNGEDGHRRTIEELIQEAVSMPELLDTSNLPPLVITDKRLQNALIPLRNENAYILPFNYEQLAFDYNEEGEIVIKSQAQFEALEEAKDENKKISAAGIDQPLLRQLFAATMKAYLCNYGNSIMVYLPSFAREMNIDVSGANKKADGDGTKHNSNDFFKKLKALETLNGVWKGGSFYRVFILEGYDAEQNTLTFSSPWLFKIIRELLTTPASKKTRADGSIMWEITGISSLMKPSIASARSKPTVEILRTLLVGLQQYGTKPEAKRHPAKKYHDKELVEYKISFKTLIERIPLVMETLDSCTPSNKTTLLQRYFCGSNFKKRQQEGNGYILEEYIRQYTLIPEYYKDFQITFQPPTVKNLADKVIIRHRGINGDFAQSNGLNALLFQGKPDGEV